MTKTKGPLKPVPYLYIKVVYIESFGFNRKGTQKQKWYKVLGQVISDYDDRWPTKFEKMKRNFPKLRPKEKEIFKFLTNTKILNSFNSNL